MKNLKSFFVFLGRNKLYTFINVFGLSVSLLFVILIANYTIGELRTDRFHQNLDRIYLLSEGQFVTGAHQVIDKLAGKYPEIEKMCGVAGTGAIKMEVLGTNRMASNLFVDSTFFDLFSFELVSGDRTSVLKSKNSAVISKSFAKKAFGDIEPLGQTIHLNDSVSVVVSGVMADFKNSMFGEEYDILLPFENAKQLAPSLIADDLSDVYSTTIFIQTYQGADITSREDDLLAYFKTFYWIYEKGVNDKVELIPMKDYYMSGIYPGNGHLKSGNFMLIMVFLSIGILILLFAVMNYINLTVSQTSFRAKEMAMLRLLGASKSAIFGKMILESLVLCSFSFVIGLLMAVSVEPYMNDLLGAKIAIFANMTPLWVIAYVGFVLLISVIAGLIPATIISHFKPIDVVKGTLRYKSKMVYSRLFIVFQNVITVFLIVAAITMVLQTRHLVSADLGYQHDAMLVIKTNALGSKENCKSFRDELNRLPCVKAVAFNRGNPLGGGNYHDMTYNDEVVSFQCITLDSVGFKMLGLEVVQDNKVGANGWWFSEYTMKFMGVPKDTTHVELDHTTRTIAGVIKDFHTRDITENMRPAFITFNEDMYPWEIWVKVNGDLGAAYKEIEKVYANFSDGTPFYGYYFDDFIRSLYTVERKAAVLVVLFAFVAVVISALGLLAMATYYVKQHSMEIAVRKVFGSTNGEILKQLMGRFLLLVALAFVIAVPLSWYAMSLMLQWYRTTIPLSPLLFITAGLFTLLIAFVTIYRQSKRAADSNPVQSIKN